MSLADLTKKKLLWPVLFAAATASASSGCEIAIIVAATADDDGDECWDACDCWGDCGPDEPPTPSPPTVNISIPDWPPLGPTGEVTVEATTANASLTTATFWFREKHEAHFPGSSTKGTVRATGADLGEGLGMMTVEVRTSGGSWTRKEVTDLLVDLSPPTAYFDDTILPASGADLVFWIADAWVVSGYELTIADKVFTETLEPGYPSTLGTDWDYSLVTIPVTEFPTGVHLGELRVFDAAGNQETIELPLTIDGIPPTAAVQSPAEGADVTGAFPIEVTGTDDLPGTVSLELSVGGALIATAIGPSAAVVVDANELPAGPIDITVIAVDEAGNKSAPSTRSVNIIHP